MSVAEENKVSLEEKEEVFKKIFELKSKQLKEDKAIFQDYQTGWLENLFEFDISSLKELEQWMDDIIEKENSPELTQLWVFYRDLIRFSYYFLTFRWVKFGKECYPTLKLTELYEDYVASLKEDFKKNNKNWDTEFLQYFSDKIKTAYEDDLWKLVDGVTTVAREFKNTTIEWYEYYLTYHKRVIPQIAKFAGNHIGEVQNYLWDRFTGVLGVWMKQLNVVPLRSVDYSFLLIENFFLMNNVVRASFFNDIKRLNPLQIKHAGLQAQLQWKNLNHYFGQKKISYNKFKKSTLISLLSVEQCEVLALRQEALCTLLKEEYPLRLQKGLNIFTLAFIRQVNDDANYETRSARFLKLNSDIEKKLDDILKRKDTRDARITAIQNIEKKSEETTEDRQKKLDEEYENLQKTRDELFSKDVSVLEKQLEENGAILDKVMKEFKESKKMQNEEYARQQEQLKADKEWKEQYDKNFAKENQFDLLRFVIRYFDKTTGEKFQEKITSIEEKNKAAQEKEKKEKRKAELEVLEKTYQQEEEKIQELLKKKKRIPKKKPELIALEKQNLEELQQIRLDEEKEKIAEEERQIALQKAEEENQLQNRIGRYVESKQNSVQGWLKKKGESFSGNSSPSNWFKKSVEGTVSYVGDKMLWFTPILNTIIFSPLDNFKLINQLGEKGSVLYKKALAQKLPFPELFNPSAESLSEEINEKFLKKFKFSEYEPHPLNRGLLVRLFKHNLLGSDGMQIAFFKIVQDQLMQYTSGTYQNYNNIFAGALSGAMMAFLMNPIDHFKTLYVATDLKVQNSIKNIHYRFTTGLGASILSSAVYRGMQFSLYEHFKRTTYMKKYNISEEEFERHTSYFNHNSYNNNLSIGQKYLAAVSASLLSSVVAYPLDTARKIIYTNTYIENPNQHLKSIRETLSLSKSWYGGFKYNCIKQIVQPITFVLWDHAASVLCNKSNSHNYLY